MAEPSLDHLTGLLRHVRLRLSVVRADVDARLFPFLL